MTLAHKTARLGEVVAAAFFDTAARYSGDPKVASRWATQGVALILRTERRGPPLGWPSFFAGDLL